MSEVSPAFLELQEILAGRYSLERELGRTSATIRFLARDVRLDRPVEIELLDPEQAGRADVRERFLAGARAAAGLFHPHIVPVHGVEESAGLAYLVRAYIAGETLGELVDSGGGLPLAQAIHLVEELAWALAYAHGRGLVHGRLAPDQVLVEAGSGRTLVSGFGLAEVLAPAREQFLAPERAQGGPPTHAADIYAFGACGRFALAPRGRRARKQGPRREEVRRALGLARADAPKETGRAALKSVGLSERVQGVKRARALFTGHDNDREEVPPDLISAIRRCLAPDPADRPASAAEVAEKVAAPGGIPSTLPRSARRLLRRIRQFSPAAAIGLLAVWVGSGGPAELLLAGSVGGLFAWMGTGLLRDARRVLREGFDLELVTRILEEEARELASHPDASSHRLQNMAIGCGGWMFYITVIPLVLAAIAVLQSLATGGGLVGTRFLGDLSVAGLLVFTMLFLAGPSEEDGSPRRWLDFGERMMVGRFGGLLFRLARIGLPRGRGPAAAALDAPTAFALSEAAQELFEGLPAEQRRQFDEVPAAIRELGEHADELRLRDGELAEALRELGSSAEEEAHGLEAARAIEVARERVRQRMAEVTAALEHLRLSLLRLAARDGAPEELTGELTLDLARAREIGADAEGLALARDEVRRLLGHAPASPGDGHHA